MQPEKIKVVPNIIFRYLYILTNYILYSICVTRSLEPLRVLMYEINKISIKVNKILVY